MKSDIQILFAFPIFMRRTHLVTGFSVITAGTNNLASKYFSISLLYVAPSILQLKTIRIELMLSAVQSRCERFSTKLTHTVFRVSWMISKGSPPNHSSTPFISCLLILSNSQQYSLPRPLCSVDTSRPQKGSQIVLWVMHSMCWRRTDSPASSQFRNPVFPSNSALATHLYHFWFSVLTARAKLFLKHVPEPNCTLPNSRWTRFRYFRSSSI